MKLFFLVGRMIPEKMFQQILALGEAWRVVCVDYQEKESKVLIRVEETPALWPQESCPHCGGQTVRGYDHAPERRWRHLNVCQLQSEIVCALPRGECQSCRKIYTVRAPWEGRSRGLTQEFEAFALTLMREMPVKKAGEILGETDQKLWRALFAHVDAAWKDLSWENVIWVGADEMNRKKGHNYLTVFVDLQAKRVLLAVEGKDAGTWDRFATELGNHNGHPKAITMVAIDMSPAYAKGVRENFANAQIVFDKFHVVTAWTAFGQMLQRQKWVVYAKRPFAGPEQVLAYLSRYTHRVAISPRRLLALTETEVTFSYKDYADGHRRKRLTLALPEFVRRFCLHLLPERFVKIRHYGLLSNRQRQERIAQVRAALGVPAVPVPTQPTVATHAESLPRCPYCGAQALIWIEEVPRPRRHTPVPIIDTS